MGSKTTQDKHLEVILEAAKSIVEGDFSKEVEIDAEGIVSNLASVINQIIRNLREVPTALDKADSQAPQISCDMESIHGFMSNATDIVLKKADEIITHSEELAKCAESCNDLDSAQALRKIKACAFDIISAQSYQDCARQQLIKMEERLQQIRDALIKVLIAFNLRKDSYTINKNTQKLIEEVKGPTCRGGRLEQDLVDELLAEFGL